MLDEGILIHKAIDVSSCDVTANLTGRKQENKWKTNLIISRRRPGFCADSYPQALAGRELPLEVSVEGSDVYSPGDVDALCHVINVL